MKEEEEEEEEEEEKEVEIIVIRGLAAGYLPLYGAHDAVKSSPICLMLLSLWN